MNHAMKTIYLSILCLFCLIFIASCDNQDEVEQQQKVDRLYFSCKINGKLIVLQSPQVLANSNELYYQRLYKLKNSAKDSALIGFAEGFQNDSLRVQIGFRRRVLSDTISHFLTFRSEEFRSQLFAEGAFRFLYDDPQWSYSSPSARNEGFYVEIVNLKDHHTFISHLTKVSDYSNIKYEDFISNNSCNITKSIILDAKTYSFNQDALYIESVFEAKLYEKGNETNSPVQLTDGHFHTVF